MTTISRRLSLSSILVLLGCASGPAGGPIPGAPTRAGGTLAVDSTRIWPVRSFEHFDLWLHGFAMLTADTAHLPLFTRGYRDEMIATRRQRNVYTALDANREALSARFVANPRLVDAQFLIFNFQSFDELTRVVDIFMRAEGSAAAVPDPAQRPLVSVLARSFRSVADREFLRLFMQALTDERARFYSAYWSQERNSRNAAMNTVESLWTTTYRARFQRFLFNSRHGDGTILLSMPLGGEGRSEFSPDGNAVAVSFPPTVQRAKEAIYVFAHEVVGEVAALAVTDNTTPAQARAGEAEKFGPISTVRGGALLLARISPDDVQDYMRFYLRAAGATVPAGDATAAFAAAYPLPEAIVDGIRRQISAVLGGI